MAIDVSGTQVSGGTSIGGGTNAQNGAAITPYDDVAAINAATQNALTIPAYHKQTEAGFWGRIVGGKSSDGGF